MYSDVVDCCGEGLSSVEHVLRDRAAPTKSEDKGKQMWKREAINARRIRSADRVQKRNASLDCKTRRLECREPRVVEHGRAYLSEKTR